jgi:hypothetical protein
MEVSLVRKGRRSGKDTTPRLVDLALAYAEAGISIIPVAPNKAATPDCTQKTPFDCTEYIRQRIATLGELRNWFESANHFGLAAVLGVVSGRLECLHLVYAAVVKLFRQLVTLQGGATLLERLPAAQADFEGRTRLYYRCPNAVSGKIRLAQFELPSEPELVRLQPLALVHGEGSWTVLPGSPAVCGDFGEVYAWVGRDLTSVPTITEDERQLLLESASCLNAWVNPATVSAPPSPDGFDTSVTWEKILLPLGWTKVIEFGEVAVWRSPRWTKPGYCAVSGIGLDRDLLYDIRSGRAYTKLGAFASFYTDGEFERARSVRLRPTPPSRWETGAGTRYLRAVKRTLPPLVSCLMPTTGDRRRFLPQAIKYFQRQTYPNLELVILCDGEDDISDLIPADDGRIRYFYLGSERHTLGSKLNSGCERARGELIAHWDDDDWSHPDRLSFQVGALLAEGAEFCGLPAILFYAIANGEVWLSRTPALLHPSLWQRLPAGATFLYRREFWSRSPFPDLQVGPDMAFIRAAGRQEHAVMVSDSRLYVAMIHTCNTDDYSGYSSLSYWVPWRGDLRKVMGADIDFYRSLRQS